jgi:hypothetical protein
LTQDTESKIKPIFKKQFSKLLNGTDHQRELNGIAKTEEGSCRQERRSSSTAFIAERVWKQNITEGSIAVGHAIRLTIEHLILQTFGRASFAGKISWLTGISKQRIAPVNVQQLPQPEKRRVLNLTLENHNVYYANGILVENCADSLTYTVEMIRRAGVEFIAPEDATETSVEEISDFENRVIYKKSLGLEFDDDPEEGFYSGNSQDEDGW